MNILIIKMGALGDVIRTTCILSGLKEKYPSSTLDWWTKKSARIIVQNSLVDKAYFEDEVPREHYDLVISLEEDMSLLLALEGRYDKIIGVFLKDQKLSYTDESREWYDMSLISRFGKDKADELKKQNEKSYPLLLYEMLSLKWKKQKYVIGINQEHCKTEFVGIVVGAGTRWPMKVLPIDLQAKLVKSLYSNGFKIMLLGGLEDNEQITALKNKCPFVHTCEPGSLEKYAQALSLCKAVITPDTMAMHLAMALKIPVVAYFTVTSADEIEIYSGHKIVAMHEDYCSYTKELKKRPNITDVVDLEKLKQKAIDLMSH